MGRMPIYEYDCASCGRRTEAIQNVGEKHLKICPHCGGALKKAFSAPAIQFKGSGFYITDYARGKKEESGSSRMSGKSGEDSGSEKGDAGSQKAEAREKAETSEKTEKKEKAEAREKSEGKSESKDKGGKKKKTET
jgi:putative FmdB family regulatory protein